MGKTYTVDQLLSELLKDKVFYRNSHGGITLSGGEVALYPEFASALLKKVKEMGIHTAIETCGYGSWENLQQIIKYTDLVLFDIKHPGSERHKQITGVDNSLILENLERLCHSGYQVILRIPLVPDVNDDEKTIADIARIAIKNRIEKIDILPFHQIGESKWAAIGKTYTFDAMHPNENDKVQFVKGLLEATNRFNAVTICC